MTTPEQPEYLPASRVWQRYGVTSMSLHRWLRDPAKRFPQPIYIGRNRFFSRAELEAWEAEQAARRAAPAAA